MINDEDLRVATTSASASYLSESHTDKQAKQLFDSMYKLMLRSPEKEKTFEAVVWPWCNVSCQQTTIADRFPHIFGSRSPDAVFPVLEYMSPNGRSQVCYKLASQENWSRETREYLLRFAGDPSKYVRQNALRELRKKKFVPDKQEMETLIGYLTRITADLRSGVTQVLLNARDSQVLAAANLLLASKNKNQRLAGLEILRELTEDSRVMDECQTIATSYQEQHKKITQLERIQLDAVLVTESEELCLDNCLGLIDPVNLTATTSPEKHDIKAVTKSTANLVKSLDEFAHLHRELEMSFTPKYSDKKETNLLGVLSTRFPGPYGDNIKRLRKELSTVLDLLDDWYKGLAKNSTDPDNFHLLRAKMWLDNMQDHYYRQDPLQSTKKRNVILSPSRRNSSCDDSKIRNQQTGPIQERKGIKESIHTNR